MISKCSSLSYYSFASFLQSIDFSLYNKLINKLLKQQTNNLLPRNKELNISTIIKYQKINSQNRYLTKSFPMRNQFNYNRTLQTIKSSTSNNSHRSNSRSPRRFQLGNSSSPIGNNPHTILNPNKLQVFIKFKPPISKATVTNKRKNRNIYPNDEIDYQFTDQPLFNDGIYNNPIRYLNEKELKVDSQLYNDKVYAFDHVYHHSKSNRQVFDRSCRGLIDQIMEKGGNGLFFVYGNTGAGKTYTMGMLDLITQKSQGIVPDAFRYLFDKKGFKNNDYNSSSKLVSPISVQFSQIYMDQVYDLFEYQNQRKLIIRQDQTTKQPYIENQIKINVSNLEQAFQVVNIGLENRKIAQQRINKRSSRGHGILTITFKTSSKTSQENLCKLCFVDLAGSQRVKQSDSKGQTLNEAVCINSSLSALETLLMNIQQRTVRMYRGNKLTRLLQPFIEVGKIRLIVTSTYDSIQPIQFAKRCKGIKFMQKDMTRKSARKDNSLSPLRQKQQKQQKQQRVKEKNFLQFIFGSVNLLCQSYSAIQQSLSNQIVHSNFTLDMPSIMNIQEIQRKTNEKINGLQEYEQSLLNSLIIQEEKNFSNISNVTQRSANRSELQQKDECSQEIFVSLINPTKAQEQESEKGGPQFSTNIQNTPRKSFINQQSNFPTSQQQIMSLLNPFKPQAFLKAIHNLGSSILNSIKNMSQLIEYKNIYKKQLFTSEVKNELLEAKNKKYENIINYLVKTTCSPPNNQNKHLHTQQNTISKHLREMGVDVSSIVKNSIGATPKLQKNQTQVKKFSTPTKRVHSKGSLNQPNMIQSKIRLQIPIRQEASQKLNQIQKLSSKSQQKIQNKNYQLQANRKSINAEQKQDKQSIHKTKRYHTENQVQMELQQYLRLQKKKSDKMSTKIEQNFQNKQINNNFGVNYNPGYGQMAYKSYNLKGKNVGNVGKIYDQINSSETTNKGSFVKSKGNLNASGFKNKQRTEQQKIGRGNQNSPLNRTRHDSKGYIFIQQK